MNAYSRTFAEDRAEVVGRGRFLVSSGGEAEVVVPLAEITEPRQIVDEQKDFGAVGSLGLARRSTSAAIAASLAAASRSAPTSLAWGSNPASRARNSAWG